MANRQHRFAGEAQQEEVPNGTMGFLDHLDELRTRLIRCCVAVTLGMLYAREKRLITPFLMLATSFVLGAVLTPSPDPWNQTALAAPMIALYLIGVVVAWIVAPRRREPADRGTLPPPLRLVFAAAVIDHVARGGRRSAAAFPRPVGPAR